jgi:hypothetical protein
MLLSTVLALMVPSDSEASNFPIELKEYGEYEEDINLVFYQSPLQEYKAFFRKKNQRLQKICPHLEKGQGRFQEQRSPHWLVEMPYQESRF